MRSYKTVQKESMNEFVERKSRFIGYCGPVTTEEQALAFIAQIRSRHFDASHNVYAYALRDNQIKRYSDDGEPQGTAGIPVLDVLLKEYVTDCVLVITRYFGGTLLGTGGLVRAYTQAAKLALQTAGIIKMRYCAGLRVECGYDFYGKLMSLIQQTDGDVENKEFGSSVTVEFFIEWEKTAEFEKKLTDLSNGTYKTVKYEERYRSAQKKI